MGGGWGGGFRVHGTCLKSLFMRAFKQQGQKAARAPSGIPPVSGGTQTPSPPVLSSPLLSPPLSLLCPLSSRLSHLSSLLSQSSVLFPLSYLSSLLSSLFSLLSLFSILSLLSYLFFPPLPPLSPPSSLLSLFSPLRSFYFFFHLPSPASMARSPSDASGRQEGGGKKKRREKPKRELW